MYEIRETVTPMACAAILGLAFYLGMGQVKVSTGATFTNDLFSNKGAVPSVVIQAPGKSSNSAAYDSND